MNKEVEVETKYLGHPNDLSRLFKSIASGAHIERQRFATRFWDAKGAFFKAGYALRQYPKKVELKELKGVERMELSSPFPNFYDAFNDLSRSGQYPQRAPIVTNYNDFKPLVDMHTDRQSVRLPINLGAEFALVEFSLDNIEYFDPLHGDLIAGEHELEAEIVKTTSLAYGDKKPDGFNILDLESYIHDNHPTEGIKRTHESKLCRAVKYISSAPSPAA